jgi:hypothetical protein
MRDEGKKLGKEDLQQMQGGKAPRRRKGGLRKPQAQAEAGLSGEGRARGTLQGGN